MKKKLINKYVLKNEDGSYKLKEDGKLYDFGDKQDEMEAEAMEMLMQLREAMKQPGYSSSTWFRTLQEETETLISGETATDVK